MVAVIGILAAIAIPQFTAYKQRGYNAAAKVDANAYTAAPAPAPAPATGRDDRFIAYDNGTVLDTSTNLMWASMDNGIDINWDNAKSY